MVFALVALASSAEISFVLKEIDTCFNQQREKLGFLQVPHCQGCQMYSRIYNNIPLKLTQDNLFGTFPSHPFLLIVMMIR